MWENTAKYNKTLKLIPCTLYRVLFIQFTLLNQKHTEIYKFNKILQKPMRVPINEGIHHLKQ